MAHVAVVGAGSWGKNLVRNFSELGVLRIVVDSAPERLKEITTLYPRLKTATTVRTVLKNKEIDSVVIATPAESHYALAQEALQAGKDVFVEKPLSLTVAEGKELVSLAREQGRVLMVGHLLLYHPAILKMKDLLDSGELGKIHYIYSTRLNLGKIRKEENILWSFAPHDISAILYLLNEMPVQVSASGGNYLHPKIADVTLTHLSFQSGVQTHIFVSWLHPYKEQKLVVVGDKKMAVFDDLEKEDKLLLYPHQISWVGRVPVPKRSQAERMTIEEKEPLKEECAHFITCVEGHKTPRTDGEEGLQVLEVLEGCQRSLLSDGQRVNLSGHSSPAQEGKSFYAHPSCTIDEPCEIGDGTKIWHYSHIMKGAKIGRDCIIGQNVLVGSGVVIGDLVKIQNNVSVYAGVTLEDSVFCGPSVVFTNVMNPRSHISRKHEFQKTLVKKGATIGANATILCGLTIGRYAFVGAGAVVTKDVPDHALVYGNPATIQGWICACGVKLKRKSGYFCPACGEKYRKGLKGMVPQ